MRSHEAVMQTNPRDVATGAASTSLPTETTMEPQKHITGGRLLAVISSVTLVAFLIMLDQAILGTVSIHGQLEPISNIPRLSLKSRVNSILFPT
jgi:hypothetical protein